MGSAQVVVGGYSDLDGCPQAQPESSSVWHPVAVARLTAAAEFSSRLYAGFDVDTNCRTAVRSFEEALEH
jgi:hypothetical protein